MSTQNKLEQKVIVKNIRVTIRFPSSDHSTVSQIRYNESDLTTTGKNILNTNIQALP